MEISNVKLNWSQILESEISHNEQLYPEINVREMYAWIISELDQNRCKSRVIVSQNKVIGYAFIYAPSGYSDRYFLSLGFVTPEDSNEERFQLLMDWGRLEARSSHKKLLFNTPYNCSNMLDTLSSKFDAIKIHRVQMQHKSPFAGPEINYPAGIKAVAPSEVAPEDLAEAEYSAYEDEKESVLLSSMQKERAFEMSERLSGHRLGPVFVPASPILIKDGKIIGAALTTIQGASPLISDLFVLQDYRNLGIAQSLLKQILSALTEKFTNVYLWTEKNSIAHSLYEKNGFTETGKSETIYFIRQE